MSENPNLPAHPCSLASSFGHQDGPNTWQYPGLTKREYIAALAMQGILANGKYDPPRRNRLSLMALDAVSAADALLDALAKEHA